MSAGRLIREAAREDAEAIAAMYQQTWPIYWETPERVRFQFDVLEPIGGKVLVALQGDRVAGHCEFIPIREPEPYSFWGYLEALEVHREFYRQGIGTALVKEAIRRCAALGCTRFGTSPNDERSEALYHKCGMSRVERRIATHFALAGDLLEPVVDAVEELPAAECPWEELLHVLGRLHCASYWWSVTFHRKEAGEKCAEDAFAARLRSGDAAAVVLYAPAWLHIFLPPQRAQDHDLLRTAVSYGAHRLKALKKESFHTLMPLHLADAVRSVPGIYPSESHFDFHMWMPLSGEKG